MKRIIYALFVICAMLSLSAAAFAQAEIVDGTYTMHHNEYYFYYNYNKVAGNNLVLSFDLSGVNPNFVSADYSKMGISFAVYDTVGVENIDYDNLDQYTLYSCIWDYNVADGHYRINLSNDTPDFVSSATCNTETYAFNAADVIGEIDIAPTGEDQLYDDAVADYAVGLKVSNFKVENIQVPEPASFAYGALGLISLLGLKKRAHK